MPHVSPQLHSLAPSTILIVEDALENMLILSAMLSKAGYAVLKASCGDEAIEIATDTRPDLILMDIMMPGMDGFETCAQIRTLPHLQQVPVIFITALGDNQSKMRAFEAGAVDYLCKPFYRPELLARIRVHLRFQKLYEASIAENLRQLRELRSAQAILMPQPSELPAANFAAFYASKQHVGGDFYDVFAAAPGCHHFVVADVSGHDLASALPTAALRALLRQHLALNYTPQEIIQRINQHLPATLAHGQYATLAYLSVNRNVHIAELFSAAHPPLFHQSGSTVNLHAPKGLPIGCFPDCNPTCERITLADKDRLFLLSDGFIEEFRGKAVPRSHGCDLLARAISESAPLALDNAVKAIAHALHPNPDLAADDLMLIGIEI